MEPLDKEARFERVADAVVVTLVRSGPDDLRVATIARRAGVSRGRVYKYFGKDRDTLLSFTARLFGDAFADLAVDRAAPDVATWRACIVEATLKGLDDVAKRPWLVTLRFRYRSTRNALGDAVRSVEDRHRDKLRAELPPVLARHPDADRFVIVFTEALFGVFHWWTDPAVRAAHTPETVAEDLAGLLDGFARQAGAVGHGRPR